MMDVTPDTHFLDSVRADRGSYWVLLAEAIDNAFDAAATEIKLTLTKELISLHDNGIGITKDRQASLVRLGEHRAMPTTALGMFGIGLKYQAISAGNILDVDSRSKDGQMLLHADWQAVERSGLWQIDDPKWIETIHSEHKTGTHIKIRSIRWPSVTARDLKTCNEKLPQYFYPALAMNRKIILNGEALPVLHEPEMKNVVDGEVRLASGKGARVHGGIIIDRSSSSLYQVQVSYKHRVLMPQSTFACGSFTGVRGMFARVELIGPWQLGRFKNEIVDNEAEELEDAVLEILLPVLELCHSAQMSLRIREMTELINDLLPPDLAAARPPHKASANAKPKTDRIKPKHPPKEITETDNSAGGPALARKRRGLIIQFDQPQVEEYGYGHFIRGRPNRVVLAQDNPHILQLLENRDKEEAARSLFAIAIALYLHERESLLEGFDRFGFQMWEMAKMQIVDSQSEIA